VLNSNDDWSEYRNSYRFDLPHIPRYEDQNQSYTGQLKHTLSAKTFYDLGVTFFKTERKRGDGLFFDNIVGYAANGSPQLSGRHSLVLPGLWRHSG